MGIALVCHPFHCLIQPLIYDNHQQLVSLAMIRLLYWIEFVGFSIPANVGISCAPYNICKINKQNSYLEFTPSQPSAGYLDANLLMFRCKVCDTVVILTAFLSPSFRGGSKRELAERQSIISPTRGRSGKLAV